MLQLQAEGAKRVAQHMALLSEDEKKLVQLLQQNDQMHLFARWEAVGVNDPKKHAFLEQLAHIDRHYSIADYVKRARLLLKGSKNNDNPYAGYLPEIPTGECLETRTAEGLQRFDALERAGLEHEVARTAFVLVAGGLGERLSYPGIKVGLPIETTTNTCFLQYYIESILAMQARANKRQPGAQATIPLAIMTSGDTDKLTRELLAAHNNFGMPAAQLTLIMQDKVPAMSDNEAHFVVEPLDPYSLVTKPHGHGDVHLLLHSSGLASRWAQEGRQWVVFFQDTNCLAFRAVLPALGVSAARKMAVNSLTVARKPGEAVGAIMRLVKADDRKEALTINVEYNQLEMLMKKEPVDSEGYSLYPGNINVLILHLPPYAANLARTGGIIGEFINPKYADATKTVFKKDARLECMMQDYPKLLAGTDALVGFTQLERWTAFSAVKNSIEDARAKQAQQIAVECAASGEADFYRAVRRILAQRAHVDIDVDGSPQTFSGIHVDVGARVVVSPSFGVTQEEIASKFGRDVHISKNSTLVLLGEDITVKSLRLDGAMIVRASPGQHVCIENAVVTNKGWRFCALKAGEKAEPQFSIRGYVVNREETFE